MAIKWLSGDYALHQIILTRAVVGILFVLAFFVPLVGGFSGLRTRKLGLHLLRGFGIVIANLCFFTGLITLPLGEATAIFFVAPLLITALSVLLLGESVGASRWAAVMSGLAGVLIVLRPSGDVFNPAGLLPLGAALAYALVHIMTRKLGRSEKASTMAFYIQLNFVIVCSIIGLLFGGGEFADPSNPTIDFLFRAWTVPSWSDVLIMLVIGFFSGLGGYFISQAYRISEASVVAPFEYAALPLSLFWSITLFSELPDTLTWMGILLIVSGGLLVFYKETLRGRLTVLSRPMPRNR